MKKILVLPILLGAFCTVSLAQTSQSQPGHMLTMEDIKKMEVNGSPIISFVTSRTEEVTKELNLNETQSRSILKVNSVVAYRMNQMEKLADAKEKQDAKLALMKYAHEEYHKVLSAEQFEKWARAHKG